MSIDFEDYLDSLAQKDNQAFAIVYENTKRGVYSIIASLVSDRHDVEDLMQDTYLKMLKNLNQYQRGRNFNAWLQEMAKNIAYDHLRKTRPIVADPQEQAYLFDKVPDGAPKNADYSMEELLSPLDPEERQIVLLRIVSRAKFKDIADSVEKPLGTVLWIYNKALAKMKKSIEKE